MHQRHCTCICILYVYTFFYRYYIIIVYLTSGQYQRKDFHKCSFAPRSLRLRREACAIGQLLCQAVWWVIYYIYMGWEDGKSNGSGMGRCHGGRYSFSVGIRLHECIFSMMRYGMKRAWKNYAFPHDPSSLHSLLRDCITQSTRQLIYVSSQLIGDLSGTHVLHLRGRGKSWLTQVRFV